MPRSGGNGAEGIDWSSGDAAAAAVGHPGGCGSILSDARADMRWLQAITFDVRRGAHSIGSNVRDAAAYLIWSLARSSLPSAIKPFASEIATTLASVACFDREVSIRRAASAAFQEHVGRMGLFPAGIEVLAKTDFYSVSVRRTAFLVAAPQVAE